jgi:nicotinate-nucleotide--dimethylbenzimidazole phosphoribosyltransferase
MISPLIDETIDAIGAPDEVCAENTRRRLSSLTKPPGSLGALEDMLIRISAIRAAPLPETWKPAMLVFCADHGVVEEGVSAWPSDVTRQMAENFLARGACISAFCREFGIDDFVIDMGIAGEPVPYARNCRIAGGTRNFARVPAMSREQAVTAIETGIALAREHAARYNLLGCGEMGIGNSTSAAALLCAFTGCDPERAAGPGAGLDEAGVARKAGVIRQALRLHASREPVDVAASFGGFEILAIAGVMLGAAAARTPVVLDGMIATSAALIVQAMAPRALAFLSPSHCSAEPGHALMLSHLGIVPPMDFGMRLGEGTGAALLIPILKAALRAYHEMATFDSAGVSGTASNPAPAGL